MKRRREVSVEDLAALLRDVRPEAQEIVARFAIERGRAEDLLTEALVGGVVWDGNDAERKRLVLEALENSCSELRAAAGPPEEDDNGPTIH